MRATDKDTGNNARLTYRILTNESREDKNSSHHHSNFNRTVGNSIKFQKSFDHLNGHNIFGIYPNSGWLYLRLPLDRESRDQYELLVVATDNGTPVLEARTHVLIRVLDSNDNDPRFQRASYEFHIEENLGRGTLVGVISATDSDLDENAAIRYNLLPSNSSFQVNPLTGKLRLPKLIILKKILSISLFVFGFDIKIILANFPVTT